MVRIAQNRLSTNVLINIAMWSVTTLEGICYIGLLVFKFDEKKSGKFLGQGKLEKGNLSWDRDIWLW
jgi:hypothetical protein